MRGYTKSSISKILILLLLDPAFPENKGDPHHRGGG